MKTTKQNVEEFFSVALSKVVILLHASHITTKYNFYTLYLLYIYILNYFTKFVKKKIEENKENILIFSNYF